MGISLSLFDICDISVFPEAPVLVPDLQDYYTNQGDLVVQVTWQMDIISATTSSICGDYSIITVLNSVTSRIDSGFVDSQLTKIK